ncbi:DUF4178 domain-containing protein [Rufibacter sediminis]|uniref:DUF4178 domain-containing protein n=1 Tax=Rufibacter sediminis TaxID=2762756 RepID=A0ABR6VM39_9BACT|nr:DUF4178 domain-containing protein [Rufibacter sediminis]MBC3538226.1 DUF4178 domain-containing protein [Rufibacter sediminis]
MNGFEVNEKGTLPAQPLQVTCPQCKNTIELFTFAQAKSVCCQKCFYLSEVKDDRLVPIQAIDKERIEPLLPIGREGKIKDVRYRVVGFLVYKEQNLKYRWREYVLFNPVHGYAYLSEYDGHWTFFRYIFDFSIGARRTQAEVYYLDREFKLYNKYRSQVMAARGEFFWATHKDTSQYLEYIAPPYMLTLSVNRTEQSWMLGEHLEPEEVKQAFALEGAMPDRLDVGAVEPFSQNFSFRYSATLAGWAAGILLVIQVLFSLFHQNKVLLDQTYTLTEEVGKGTLLPLPGPTIDIGSSFLGSTNVQVFLRAPVTNTWFATGISLLNVKTGREYFVEVGVEFYSGYEDGERWSEGSPGTDHILSSLPSGTYQVYLQPSREGFAFGASRPESFHLMLVQDVPIWSNFWIALLLLAAVPAVQGMRHYNFEKNRWMNSDYSPYEQE